MQSLVQNRLRLIGLRAYTAPEVVLEPLAQRFENDIFLFGTLLLMFVRLHAKFRAKPAPFDRVTSTQGAP